MSFLIYIVLVAIAYNMGAIPSTSGFFWAGFIVWILHIGFYEQGK